MPQGSVLGPILFLLYINDLSRTVQEGTARLFADDTSIVTYNKKLENLIERSKIVYRGLFRWCICNRLTINYSKTCFLLFHTKNKRVPHDFNEIKIDDIIISRSRVTNYLGLHIDENLNWNYHINQLCQRLTQFFGVFKRVKDQVTHKLVRQLYFAFIYSRISYGIQVYGGCSDSNMNNIQTIQSKLLKFFLSLDQRNPTNDLHANLKILKVKDIY